MGSREEIAIVLGHLKAIPADARAPIVEQLSAFKNVLGSSERAKSLEETLKVSREFNSALYLMEFALTEVEDEDIHASITGLENTIAGRLAQQLMDCAARNNLTLLQHEASQEIIHLADLVIECDEHLQERKRAA